MTTGVLDQLSRALSDRYRVEREVGAGGMATVYLAHDLRHDRDVAIKVLHQDLAAALGAERFLAEIKTTARLQHPHILPLLDSGNADGLLYYVMPFVAGESLRDRLSREKQLPIDDAVRIAREIADALGHAHSHDVIHRDIKPENILLQEGHALVADFGIALAVQSAGGQRMTQTGLSLGTPQYMSPEQAMGEKGIDARSDIYALGAVTYEMLTGEAPFTGATVQAIVARVLSEQARPLTSVRKSVPSHVEDAVLGALEKLPADRCASAAVFAAQLSGTTASRSGPRAGSSSRAALAPRLRAAIGVGVAAVALLGYLAGARRGEVRTEFDVGLPDSLPIAFAKGGLWGEGWRAVAVGPDASFLVYIADRGATTALWWRSLVDESSKPIPNTNGVAQFALSPDGRSVILLAAGAARIVSLADQSVEQLGTFSRVTGVTWMTNDRVLIADNSGQRLIYVDRQAGARDTLFSSGMCYTPQVLASVDSILCSSLAGDGLRVQTRTGVIPIESPGGPLLGGDARWVDHRLLLWMSAQGDLMAASWDGPGKRTGRPVRALHGLRSEGGVSGTGQYVLGANGLLVYAPGENAGVGQLVALGRPPALETLPIPRGAIKQFDFSRRRNRVAVSSRVADGDELSVFDIASAKGARWLLARSIDEPRWNPAGDRIVVQIGDRTVVGDPDANLPTDSLKGVSATPSDWPLQDLLIATTQSGAATAGDVVFVHQRPTGVAADTVRAPGEQSRAVLSPDGRWLAMMSADNVIIEDYPRHTRRYTVARGLDPLWVSASELVLRDGIVWHWYRIDPGTGEARGESRPPWRDDQFIDTPIRSQALTADGRLVYLRGSGRGTGAYVHVVQNWLTQVDRAVKAAGR